METQTDEQLASRSARGDQPAFEILLRRYLKIIYGFVYRLLGNTQDAEEEDATQEVFLKSWKNLKRFDEQRSFKAWIFGIARHTAIDLL